MADDLPPAIKCRYMNPSGARCSNDAGPGGLCFWHAPDHPKNGSGIKELLSEEASKGQAMSGFCLANAELEGINLGRSREDAAIDLSYSDLYQANLRKGRLYNLNLKGALLNKANLQSANLQFANLEDADLLGVNLRRAKIDHVRWGDRLIQEKQAKIAELNRDYEVSVTLYQQAEEIYRNLRKVMKDQGLYDLAGAFLYRELVSRRRQMPRHSARRILSKIFDLLCGYGEKPLRVIAFALLVLFGSATAYYSVGIEATGEIIRFNTDVAISQNLLNYSKCLYFSVVTFTTLGYGDFIPTGMGRLVSVFESIIGSFSIALFVVLFVKKMTRH